MESPQSLETLGAQDTGLIDLIEFCA